MRVRSAAEHRPGALDVAMTPMIDVVFMLLIFFVWTASFQIAELTLPSSLITQPMDQGNTQLQPEFEDFERIVVRVGWHENAPTWVVNDVPVVRFADLRTRLMAVARIKNDLPVLVDPDGEVPLGDVISVYDAAREAGFENVQFATPAD